MGLGLVLTLAGCSAPPQPVPEPTGEDLERAWRVAVGSDDPLDQTLAQVYAMAMNSHETPTVVVQADDATAVELAVGLAATAPGSDSSPETPDDETAAVIEGTGETPDDRYEMVVARTMPLAEALDPEGFADLTAPDEENGRGPAAEPEELAALVESQLSRAQLFEPTTAVLRNGLIITTVTAENYEVDAEEETAFDELAERCGELSIGVTGSLPDAAPLLNETYGCAPAEIHAGREDELIELLITAEIDAALMTSSHPDVDDHALVTVTDARRAFPQDQYAPLVSSRIAEEVPGVVEDISLALDDEALLTLRRLIHGEDALEPEDAAVYWLVDEGLLAEPESWG